MKKFFAIVFLLVFFLAQYGKLVSYSYCKIKADIQAVTCDCEKKWLTDPNPNPTGTHLIMKEKSEDVYLKFDFGYHYSKPIITQSPFPVKVSICEGVHSALFHPPLI